MKGINKYFLAIVFWGSTFCADAQNINNPNKMGPLGTQVNTLSGNLFIPRNDIFISARGFDLALSFYYNSYDYNQDFSYGNGWSFGYDIRYRTDSNLSKIIKWGDGREDEYKLVAANNYKAPRGFFDTLTQYLPMKFRLKQLDGTTYFFDNNVHKRITKMQEPNGNAINFVYTDTLLTSLTNTAGQSITFTYNATGRLVSLVDAVASPSRTYTYTYDAAGNLKEVTDPLNGKNKYTYLTNGPMKTLSDKNNNSLNIIYYSNFSAREIIGCNKRTSYSYDTLSQKTIVTDHLQSGNNQITTYTYKKIENIGWITSMSGNCCGYNILYDYDDQGNKIKETDANGNIYKYTYDTRGNMLTMADPLNQVNTYTYENVYNNITSFIDNKGNVYTLSYDAKGNLTQLSSPGSLVYTATYNTNGDITTSTDPKGNIYAYNYDAYGNPTNVTAPNGYSSTLVYNARGILLSHTDARGNTHATEFDILDRLKKIIDPASKEIKMNYDAEGNATSILNKNNEITQFNYDASNRVVKVKDPIGNQTEMTYDGMNNVLTAKNALGNTMSFGYDNRNRLIKTTDPLNNNASFTYDQNGNITNTTLPNGQAVNYTYDVLNRVTAISDITGTIGTLTYDKNNNVTSYTNATGAVVTATYDSLNRAKKVTDPLGNSMLYAYDKNSNVTAVTDRNGFTQTYTYDSLNRVKTHTDNNGFVITVGYDAQGNVINAKDQNNNTTTYAYYNLNRLTTTTYPDGRFLQYTYDVKNNIIAKRLTDATVINYQYDAINRVIAKTLPSGVVYTYTYDSLSRMITATNNYGTITLAYDKLNRIISESYDGRTTKYSYDIAGRTQTTIYPDSTVVTQLFDTRNRLIEILKNNITLVSYQYNNVNQNTNKTFANGISTTMQYDFADRLTNISTANGSIQNTNFTYDKELNKTSINRLNNPALSESFVYDNGYRLTNYKRGVIGGTTSIQNTYSYDALGNRTNANVNGANTTYTSNNLNQLTNSNTGSQNINFVYDNRGNLTYDGLFFKTYDAEGRLLKDSSAPASVITYAYDAFNRRIIKTTNGTPLKYTYSGLAQIEERNSSNIILNKTIFTNFLSPIVNEKSGSNFYYHSNELNSVEAISNNNGRLVESYQYDVFGKPSRFDSLNAPLNYSIAGNRVGFTGQEYDSASGSYRFFFRNYSPTTGVFNQRDLIGYADGMGMYQYVGNNPANGVDVLGLEDCDEKKTRKDISYKVSFSNALKNVFISKWLSELGKPFPGSSIAEHELNVRKYKILMEESLKHRFGSQRNKASARNYSKTAANLLPKIRNEEAIRKVKIDAFDAKSARNAKGLKSLGKGLNLLDNLVKAEAFASSLVDGEDDGYHTQETKAGIDLGLSIAGWTPWGAAYGSFDFVMETTSGDGFTTHVGSAGTFLGDASSAYQSGRPVNMQWGRPARTDENITSGNFYAKYFYGVPDEDLQNSGFPCPPTGGTRRPPSAPNFGTGADMEILTSNDPNEIIGPAGQPSVKWVSVKDRMPYTVLYENSPQATAPAKFVRITTPIEPKQDANTFELGNFGFNSTTFIIPPNTAAYYNRLDVRDSLGLYVDITAGYDQMNNVAFWEFQTIDPITLQPPTNPLKGFLLQQDSAAILYGHGFVNFSIKPKQSSLTLDTIGAKAKIVFDTNDTIPTNIYTNTIDAFPPTSHIANLPPTSNNPINLSWTGADDINGCGIRFYTLYVSTDGVNFSIFANNLKRTDTSFTLSTDSTFCFFVLATDSVGNMETLRQSEIKCSKINNATILPLKDLILYGRNEDKNNELFWNTTSEYNTQSFDIERSLNGNSFTKISNKLAAGNSNTQRNYNFTDNNIHNLNSASMYYRLKQIDKNNQYVYSNIIRLQYNKNSFKPTIIYPNPTNGILTISSTIQSLIGSWAIVTDVNGRVIQKIKITSSNQVVNISTQINGTYYIKLSNKEIFKILKF